MYCARIFVFRALMDSLLKKLRTTLAMIKFEHTLFALPFAFLGVGLIVFHFLKGKPR